MKAQVKDQALGPTRWLCKQVLSKTLHIYNKFRNLVCCPTKTIFFLACDFFIAYASSKRLSEANSNVQSYQSVCGSHTHTDIVWM